MKRTHEAFRATEEIEEMVDAYIERLRRDNPGMTISRSDALKNLVILGCRAAKEKDHGEGQD